MNFERQYEIRRRSPSDISLHLPFLHNTALSYPAPIIIELGVRTGNSTAAFLCAMEERSHGHLWSVDIQPPHVPSDWLTCPYWTLTVADDMDSGVIDHLKRDTYPGADVLFIDTSHEHDHTMAELEAYVPLVKPGGTVLMHDTEHPAHDVNLVLEEFCARENLTWENRPGSCGLGVIRIPEGHAS